MVPEDADGPDGWEWWVKGEVVHQVPIGGLIPHQATQDQYPLTLLNTHMGQRWGGAPGPHITM